MITSKIKKISEFDEITKFRLINLFFFGVCYNLMVPILMDIRGELLTATFISFIMILATLSVKTNEYFVTKFTKSELYKLGIFVHFAFMLGSLTYFYDKLLFVYLDSFLGIAEAAIFSAYSIKLDVHMTDRHPSDVSKFKVFRNSLYADAILIGLSMVWVSSLIGGNDASIMIFIFFNTFFLMWMFYNWNLIENAMQKYGNTDK